MKTEWDNVAVAFGKAGLKAGPQHVMPPWPSASYTLNRTAVSAESPPHIAWLSSSANFFTDCLIFSCVRADGRRLPHTYCDSCALLMPVMRDMPAKVKDALVVPQERGGVIYESELRIHTASCLPNKWKTAFWAEHHHSLDTLAPRYHPLRRDAATGKVSLRGRAVGDGEIVARCDRCLRVSRVSRGILSAQIRVIRGDCCPRISRITRITIRADSCDPWRLLSAYLACREEYYPRRFV